MAIVDFDSVGGESAALDLGNNGFCVSSDLGIRDDFERSINLGIVICLGGIHLQEKTKRDCGTL